MLVCCCGREKKKVAAGKITRTEVKKKSSFALSADTGAVRGRVCVGKKKPVRWLKELLQQRLQEKTNKAAAGKITRTEVKKKSSFALGADTGA